MGWADNELGFSTLLLPTPVIHRTHRLALLSFAAQCQPSTFSSPACFFDNTTINCIVLNYTAVHFHSAILRIVHIGFPLD